MRPILASTTVRDVAGRGWEFQLLGPSDRPSGDRTPYIAIRRNDEDRPSFFGLVAIESVAAWITEAVRPKVGFDQGEPK